MRQLRRACENASQNKWQCLNLIFISPLPKNSPQASFRLSFYWEPRKKRLGFPIPIESSFQKSLCELAGLALNQSMPELRVSSNTKANGATSILTGQAVLTHGVQLFALQSSRGCFNSPERFILIAQASTSLSISERQLARTLQERFRTFLFALDFS